MLASGRTRLLLFNSDGSLLISSFGKRPRKASSRRVTGPFLDSTGSDPHTGPLRQQVLDLSNMHLGTPDAQQKIKAA